MPYHHDREYTLNNTANPDIFVNTMFHQALIGRVCTDWSGPESDIRSMALRMSRPVCPGDVLRLEGIVQRKYRAGTEARVDIAVTESNASGPTSSSTVTLAMPTQQGDVVTAAPALREPEAEITPDTPDFARDWLASESPDIWSPYPVSVPQIMYWSDMIEDGNPLYVDGPYADRGRFGGVIAPWHALMIWGMPRAGHMGLGDQVDYGSPERKRWPPSGEPVINRFVFPDAPVGIVNTITQEYGAPLRPGDRTFSRTRFLGCSSLKSTRLGKGYFSKQVLLTYNQHGELIGTNVTSGFRYGGSD
jgi:acyl dehydratase